jgi:hypothetical protein
MHTSTSALQMLRLFAALHKLPHSDDDVVSFKVSDPMIPAVEYEIAVVNKGVTRSTQRIFLVTVTPMMTPGR